MAGEDFGTALVCALVATRNASIAARLEGAPEAESIDAARALLGQAVEEFMVAAGLTNMWVDTFMADVRTGQEPMMHEFLTLADAARQAVLGFMNGKVPELRRVQAASMFREVVRLVRGWCEIRGIPPGEFDSRLTDPAFCK